MDLAGWGLQMDFEANCLVSDDALTAIQRRLAQSAAHVVGCECVAFLPGLGGTRDLVSCVGPGVSLTARATDWIGDQLTALRPGDAPFVSDVGDVPMLRDFLMDNGGETLSLIALPAWDHDEVFHGALLLIGQQELPRISPAQQYVLTTHGLQFGEALRRGAPRHTGDGESARAERLRLLESVVVHANDAILITEAEPIDLPGPRIVYCNAAFTRTTGYAEAEIVGKTPRLLQSPQTDRGALDRLRGALERWEPVEVELLNTAKDGTEFWVELSIVPVANEQGWFTHWVSVQRDISQRRAAEEVAVRARVAEVENKALAAEIRERKNVQEQLFYAAYHDDLTRLRNRAYFMDRLATLLGIGAETHLQDGDGQRSNRCLVLFLDLDRFKLVNDSLGHRAGDLLLIEVARRLRTCIRPEDTLARVGGDEFAIVIENDNALTTAIKAAERILDSLHGPIALGPSEVFTSCSVGIVQAAGGYDKPEDLLRDADIAMYKAKKSGGTGYAIFSEEMHADASKSLTLQTDLRHALARSEFVLHYQPIFNAITGRMIGLEALVRWMHPSRGLVSPAAFISLAEEIGLIRDLDRWVLRQACLQMRAWQVRYPHFIAKLSVNVSGDELRDPGFLDELRQVLETTDLGGGSLQIEITEGVFLREPALIERTLAEIRRLGVSIALDDFGTGYSSLGYLDRYQIDTLKIDRTFVERMLRQDRAMSIMDGIVRLGNALKLDIVAEGVETESQLDALRSMSCCNVQGYLLGRPLPADEISSLLQKQSDDELVPGRVDSVTLY